METSSPQWLVLYAGHSHYPGRIGSVPLNEHNRDIVRKHFKGQRMQTDASGGEHWQLFAYPTDKSMKGVEFIQTH